MAAGEIDARCNGYGSGHWSLETTAALTARIEAEARNRGVFPGVLVAEAVACIGTEPAHERIARGEGAGFPPSVLSGGST